MKQYSKPRKSLAKWLWLATKTPLTKLNRGEGIVSIKPMQAEECFGLGFMETIPYHDNASSQEFF